MNNSNMYSSYMLVTDKDFNMLAAALYVVYLHNTVLFFVKSCRYFSDFMALYYISLTVFIVL